VRHWFTCLTCAANGVKPKVFVRAIDRDNWHDNHLRHTGHDKDRLMWAEVTDPDRSA
jgi:hypothetical protein